MNPSPIARRRVAQALFFCLNTGIAMAQAAPNPCGSLNNAYGPYDYRTERTGKLHIVEEYHFTPEVEALVRGKSSAYVADDLNYTLHTSPNHHRALMAIVRLGERTKSSQPPHLQYSITCYFDRAIRFQPDDTVVRLIYAQYLGNTGRVPQAVQQLKIATGLAKDNPLAHYNIGLIYFELKKYDEALAQAHIAMAMGFTRHELADQLKQVGRWSDPIPAQAAASAASAPGGAGQ